MENQLDDVDRRMIELLKLDGRMPIAAIARDVGMSDGAVRRRLTHLTDTNAVRIVGVSPAAMHGLDMAIIFALQLQLIELEPVVAALTEMEELAFVYETSGRFNILAVGFFADQNSFRNFLATTLSRVEGITLVETLNILVTRKSDFGLTSRAV